MSAMHVALLLVSAVAFAADPALAQIYRWVDEKGVTHYGQRPEGNGAGGAHELNMKDPTGGAKPAETPPPTVTRRVVSSGGMTVIEERNETPQQRQEREFQERHADRQREIDATARQRSSIAAAQQNQRRASCENAQRSLASTSLRHSQQRRDYQAIISRDC